MERKQTKKTGTAEQAVRNIRRATRRQYSSEEKIRIALEGLRGEDSIAELCRREGINQNLYYRWSKEFLDLTYGPSVFYVSNAQKSGRN